MSEIQKPSFMLMQIIMPRWELANRYSDAEGWYFISGMLHMISLVYNTFEREFPSEDFELLRDIAKLRGRDAKEKSRKA